MISFVSFFSRAMPIGSSIIVIFSSPFRYRFLRVNAHAIFVLMRQKLSTAGFRRLRRRFHILAFARFLIDYIRAFYRLMPIAVDSCSEDISTKSSPDILTAIEGGLSSIRMEER